MLEGTKPSYEMVCKLVGQLYLESRFQIEQLAVLHKQETDELRRQMDVLRKERDDALKLVVGREDGPV